MNKAIITVGGDKYSKRQFHKVIKESSNGKKKVWSADPLKEIEYIVGLLGWNGGDKGQVYQDVYTQLFDLAEKSFGFKKVYVQRTIDRFWSDENSEILVLYNTDEMIEDLKAEDGLFSLFVAKSQTEVDDNLNKYDKVILMDSQFEQSVKQTIDVLTEKEKA